MQKKMMEVNTKNPIECCFGAAQLRIPEMLEGYFTGSKMAVISDREVFGYYGEDFVNQFKRKDIPVSVIIVDGNQSAKSVDAVKQVYEGLIDASFHEKDMIVAFGGGGILDISGFAAKTFFGGAPLVQVPTSLLAMVDSVESPYAYLNFQSYKDRLQVKSDPIYTMIDTQYLRTLPSRYYANGIAEIIRYGLLTAPELLPLLSAEKIEMDTLIEKSIQAKITLLQPKNDSIRDFGREIGAAIEGHFRFLKYSHGEALALSMLSMFPSSDLRELYDRFNLPQKIEGVTKDTLLKRLTKDVLVTKDPVKYGMVKEPGKPFVQESSVEEASEQFNDFLSSICLVGG